MYKILEDKDKNQFEDFVINNKKGHFMQSLKWVDIKEEWKNEVVISVDENGKIVGGLNILIRKVPYINRSIMYSPRGPVCDIHNEEILKDLVEGAKVLAKKHRAFILRIDPDIKNTDKEFKDLAKKLGFKIKDNIKKFSDGIQPRYVFRLDVKDKNEEELLKSFHEKTRYNIRLSMRKGVTIKDGTKEDLKDFHKIMQETGNRDHFGIRPLSYFEKMYDVLAPNNMKVFMAYYDGKPIAGTIPIIYGNKVWYLYGASSNQYRNVMPNYLLQWEMIKLALENKADIYDFRGVEEFEDETKQEYGVYKFKKGFKGEFIEFIGEIQLVFNPFINFCFDKTLKIYKKLKMKIK